MTEDNNTGNFAAGLLLGSAIGMVIGILCAPRKGSETRNLVREKVAKTMQATEQVLENIRERASKIIENTKSSTRQILGDE